METTKWPNWSSPLLRVPVLMTLLLAAVLPVSGVTAGGRPVTGFSSTTVSNDIALTVTVVRRSYPRNALVPVTLRAQNVSGHTIYVMHFAYCTAPSLSAEVDDRRGNPVYPPPASTWIRLPCPLSLRTDALAAGHALVRRDFVILRANRIVPDVLLRGPFGSNQNLIGVTGSPLSLALTSAASPRITLHSSPPVGATIQQTSGGSVGPPYYTESGECPQGNRFLAWSDATWHAVSASASGRYVVHPHCRNASNWSLVVGWPNQPVASIHFGKGSDQ